MFKKLLLAAAMVFSFGSVGTAATVNMVAGGTYDPFNTSDTYGYDEVLSGTGGAGSRSFTFVVAAADAPLATLGVAAHAFVGDSNSLSGVVVSWTSSLGTTNAAPLIYTNNGYYAEFTNLFTASPDTLSQTLTLAWTGYTGDVRLSLQVAAVPVPAGGLLLLSALGGIAAIRRRRKAAVAA